jgi:4-hydroxybenzoate polyprenyltransferase
VPGIFFIPLAGPPVFLLLGPWLVLVLLIIPPAAFLLTLALVAAVAGGLLFALGALIASPYLLARHLHARHEVRASQPVQRRAFAFAHRHPLPKGTS